MLVPLKPTQKNPRISRALLLNLAYSFHFRNGFLEHPLNTLLEGYNGHCSPVASTLEPNLHDPVLDVYQFHIPAIALEKWTNLV